MAGVNDWQHGYDRGGAKPDQPAPPFYEAQADWKRVLQLSAQLTAIEDAYPVAREILSIALRHA